MPTSTPTARRKRRPAAQTREHVLEVAGGLFYAEGIHATGIDRVASQADVAPTTLYRLFASKDDLVAGYIEFSAAGYREFIHSATDPAVGTPRERILALFDATLEAVRPEACRGCPFLMALAEYPDQASSVHRAAVAMKAWVRDRLRELVREHHAQTPLADPEQTADQLALVLEGIYGSVQALTAAGPASQAPSVAAAVLDTAAASPRA